MWEGVSNRGLTIAVTNVDNDGGCGEKTSRPSDTNFVGLGSSSSFLEMILLEMMLLQQDPSQDFVCDPSHGDAAVV